MAAAEGGGLKPVKWLLDLIYPPKCVLCGRLLQKDEENACPRCLLELPILTVLLDGGDFYSACAAPFRYEGKLRESILRYKFGGKRHYAQFYAEYLAASIRAQLGGKFDLITWVPISRRRRRERGYDQARTLAELTAKRLGCPCVQTLKKTKHNRRQSGIDSDEARRANVKGVYRAVKPERFAGKRLLLIDDIITTGSTISECAFTLRRAGASGVAAAVTAAARAPKTTVSR